MAAWTGPRATRFPAPGRRHRESVDGEKRGGSAALTIGRGTPPGNSTRVFPRRGHPEGRHPVLCLRVVPGSILKKALPGKQLCPKPGSGALFVFFQWKSWQDSHCQRLDKIPGNLKVFKHFLHMLNSGQREHQSGELALLPLFCNCMPVSRLRFAYSTFLARICKTSPTLMRTPLPSCMAT